MGSSDVNAHGDPSIGAMLLVREVLRSKIGVGPLSREAGVHRSASVNTNPEIRRATERYLGIEDDHNGIIGTDTLSQLVHVVASTHDMPRAAAVDWSFVSGYLLLASGGHELKPEQIGVMLRWFDTVGPVMDPSWFWRTPDRG